MDQSDLDLIRATLDRPIALIGLMGAGKTKIGQALAAALNIGFIDSDEAIIAQEGMSVAEIFESKGEAYFRARERAVIADLLDGGPIVLATGGGAVMTPETGALVFSHALPIWLKADVEVLLARVCRNIDKRPLLKKGDPRAILQDLADKRYPVYAKAALHVESRDAPLEENLNCVVKALAGHLS